MEDEKDLEVAINDFLDEHCSSAEELFAFITYTLHQVFVLQITTDINKALQIFETINERGVGLNPLDLIKNRLFCHIDKKDFKILKDKWQEIFKLFRKNETHKLRFIRYFLMANFPDKIDSGIYNNGRCAQRAFHCRLQGEWDDALICGGISEGKKA